MVGLLSGLRHIARIDGNGQTLHSVLKTIGGEVHVEAQPAEVFSESLAVTLLFTSSVASELKKIYLSGDAHD